MRKHQVMPDPLPTIDPTALAVAQESIKSRLILCRPWTWPRLQCHKTASSRASYFADHVPDHAGAQYTVFTITVTQNILERTGWQSVVSAYSKLEHDVNVVLTWSAADKLSLSIMPSAIIRCTQQMFMHIDGNDADLACAPRPANTIFFDLEQFNFRLLVSAHVCTYVSSLLLVS